ncbi:MAG: ion transporter [Deltaproteobacteria bacterium]|nr:ion transporter [Deltaproteobacteria bacterium]
MVQQVDVSPLRLTWRERLCEIMEPYRGGAGSTRLSLIVDLGVLLCIAVSIALIPIEVACPQWEPLIWRIELGFTAVFAVEYLLRWYAAPNRLLYPFTVYALIDLLAILPSLLMLGSQALVLRSVRALRLLRLVRLLRVLRLLRFVRYGFLIGRGLLELRIWLSAHIYQYRLRQLGRVLLYMVAVWIIGSNLLFVTEHQLDAPGGPFSEYWPSYWNMLFVLISGLDDSKEPLSLLGRIEVTLLLVAGMCLVGVLTGEIVSVIVRAVQRAGRVALKPPGERLEQHILILGCNAHLDGIVRQLHGSLRGRYYVVVVCPDAEQLPATDHAVYRKVFALAGDPGDSRTLEQADVDTAFRVIVLASAEGETDVRAVDSRSLMRTLAVICRGRAIPIVTELLSEESRLDAAGLPGVEFVLSRSFAEKLMAQFAVNRDASAIYDQLMTLSGHSSELYTVAVPRSLVGRSFGDAQRHLLEREVESVVPIGIDRSPPGAPSTRFWINPVAGTGALSPAELVLRDGDRLICIAFERPSFGAVSEEDLWRGTVLLPR